jgi:hypothetical protein
MARGRQGREGHPSRDKVWTPPGRLDAPEPGEGLARRWVRFELHSEPQDSNVYERVRQGYRPVMAEELGNNYPVDSVRDGRHSGVVRSGDLILMEIDEDIRDQRNAYYEAQSKRMQEAVDHELGRSNSQEMPIVKEAKSSVTRGTEPGRRVEFADD